jgi:HEPN domain-containing protein
MGIEKSKEEARRWFQTAESDLKTARILHANQRYAHACFHAQQAGEKSLI